MQAVRPTVLRAPARQVRSIHTARRASLPRSALRTARRVERRNASTDSPAVSGGSSGALAGGLAGGLTAFLLGYGYYRYSGAAAAVDYATKTKSQLDNAFKSATEKAPNPSQAVTWLKETVTGYTKFVPGANQYVETAFADIEKVQEKHGDEVNNIVKDAYEELKDITKGGASLAAAGSAATVLQKAMKRIGELAGDAAEDIIANHPELKEKFGDKYKQLQQMADQYGPEAKKQLEDTVGQVKDIVKGGFSSENISKVQKLIEEKTQELKKYGEKAWEEGLKQAQPILDKNPELKDIVDKNKDKLLQGDLGQLWNKVQEVTKSGNIEDAKKFVQDQVEKGQKSLSGGGSGIEALLGSIFPGGGDIGKKFSQLQEVGQKHGKEAEALLKSTVEELKKVLDKKVEEGKDLKNKAEKDAGAK